MDGNLTTLKIDLGINAQNIMQNFKFHNQKIEEQVRKGVEQAFEELMDEDKFVELIKAQTKETVMHTVKSAAASWEFRTKIEKALSERLEDRVAKYADEVADRVLNNL